jgi:hypothetical protein
MPDNRFNISRQRGIGVLEAVIAAIMISLLIVIFFGRILKLSATVEREAMQQTVNQINSYVNIESLTLLIKNDQEKLAAWDGGNPMLLLPVPPLQYKGSLVETDPMEVSPGSWYFDETNGLLIYRINHIEQFSGGRAIPERVRFRLNATFEDKNNNALKDDNERYTGLRFESLDAYEWYSTVKE